MASFLQFLVLIGFHNSLNTNSKWSGTSDFIDILLDSLHGFSSLLVCVTSFPQLLVLFGFHNSLNINPKRSGTSDLILSWFVRLFPTAPGFVRLPQLDYTNPKRNGTSDFILTFVQEQLSVSYGTRTSIESESR